MRHEWAAWITVFLVVLLPLITEDLTGDVYADQNVLLDNLIAVGTVLGVIGLYHARELLYRQLNVEQAKVLIERTYET